MRTLGLMLVAALVVGSVGCNSDPGSEKSGDDSGVGDSWTQVTDADDDDVGAADTESAKDTVEDASVVDSGNDTSAADISPDVEDTSGEDTSDVVVDVVEDTSGGGDVADTSDATSDGGSDGSDGGDAGDAAAGSWSSCSKSSECMLRKNNCCGWCGKPMLSDLDAVNRNRTSQHDKAVCPQPKPCPLCVSAPIPPGFKARCKKSMCQKVDLSSYNSCTLDTDCRVRTLDCCEDCRSDTNKGALVAINVNQASKVKKALCPPNPTCARCPISYPSSVKAVCQQGTCKLK
mgnify:CR=1 FL=1